ncbi:cytochrome p450 [Moniliophthora roreri]|nr:cytochrome p450 [Moniliophthora roreri]
MLYNSRHCFHSAFGLPIVVVSAVTLPIFLKEDSTHKPSPPDIKDEDHYTFGFGHRICSGRHLAFNVLFTFAVTLSAMQLEVGKDNDGVSVEDVESGASRRAQHEELYFRRVYSRARSPEALEMLKSVKEEWALAE